MPRISYGEDADQQLNLAVPKGRPLGTALLLHGGFWRDAWTATLMEPLAEDLLGRGWSTANIEFRRMNEAGAGGYPRVLMDVASAMVALAQRGEEEVPRPWVTIGHSAGGHLALWAAAQRPLAARTAGPRPLIGLDGAVAQAGVLDLVGASRARIGRNAVALMMGAMPEQAPERYARACPMMLLQLGVPQLLVHGTEDQHVPWEMSQRYHRAAAGAGDEVELRLLEGVGHFEHLNPAHGAWGAVVEWLGRLSSGDGEQSGGERSGTGITVGREPRL